MKTKQLLWKRQDLFIFNFFYAWNYWSMMPLGRLVPLELLQSYYLSQSFSELDTRANVQLLSLFPQRFVLLVVQPARHKFAENSSSHSSHKRSWNSWNWYKIILKIIKFLQYSNFKNYQIPKMLGFGKLSNFRIFKNFLNYQISGVFQIFRNCTIVNFTV